MNKIFRPVEWSAKTNIYEVNVRQYTEEGTFEAFSRHIPRLKDMGVEVLWFMPITPISTKTRQGSLGSYYACSDYVSVNPEFGTLDDFKAIVRLAHAHDLKVIIDWVANHTGWDHTWVHSNPEFYKKNEQGEFYDTNNWHDVIDLNYYDQAMRREMVAAMRFWVEEAGIDGFRCDMAHLVPLDFWRNARQELDEIRPLFWLAETEQVNYDTVFDCVYGWNWMHQTEAYFQHKAGIEKLHTAIQLMDRAFPQCYHMLFTSNHDENSWNGTEYEKYGAGAATLAVFSSTWKSIPLIYSGQEAPNEKRLLFFDKDLIAWPSDMGLHRFYKTLLELRRNHPALTAEKNSAVILLETGSPEKVIAFLREAEGRQVLVILNLSADELMISLNHPKLEGTYREVFTGAETEIGGSRSFPLAAWGYLVYTD